MKITERSIKLCQDKNEYNEGLALIAKEDRSFLQSYEYGQLQSKIGNQVLYLGMYQEERIIKSWLLILIKAKRGTFLFCPYGTFTADELEAVREYCLLRKDLKIDFLRFSPLMDDTAENLKLFAENDFKPAPVHMMHPELDWRLDITKTEKEILAEMRKNNRYGINKAQKDGVKVISGDSPELLEKFYLLHAETAKRHGFTPWSRSFLEAQLAVFSPLDQIKVYLAEYDGKIIAGAVIMFYEGRAYYHHGASDDAYNKIPASYLIQWLAILEAKKRGFQEYSFYGVVDNAPKHPWAGLSFFKKGFGGYGKHILHCQDLPISWKYWLNWSVEKIRRWKKGY